MVRDELRELIAPLPGDRLDPGADLGVRLRSPGLGQARVRDVPNDRVLEHVLGLASEGGRGPDEDQTLPLQLVESACDIVVSRLCQRSRPEDATHHGRLLKGPMDGSRQPVNPRRHERLHAVWNGRRCRTGCAPMAILVDHRSLVDEPLDDLLDEEWVALRLGQDLGA